MGMPERLPTPLPALPEDAASRAPAARVVASPKVASAEFTVVPKRRSFSAKYKLQILAETESASGKGGISAILRREGELCPKVDGAVKVDSFWVLDRLYSGMITVRDRRTGDLFDRWSELGDKWRRLLDCSWARVFREHLLDDLPIDELLAQFDDRLGCTSKDLHIVIGVLLLQQRHDLSDAATVEALAFNLTWHHALPLLS